MDNKELLRKMTINGEEYVSVTGLLDYICEEFGTPMRDGIDYAYLHESDDEIVDRIRYDLYCIGRDDLAKYLVERWLETRFPFMFKKKS